MTNLRVTVVVEPDDDGFHAYCPAFKGLHVDGKTELEALQRTEEALHAYLDSLRSHGEGPPIGEHCKAEEGSAIVAELSPAWGRLSNAVVGSRERSFEALCVQ